MPTAPTNYTLLKGTAGDYAGIIYTDANGSIAIVTNPWYLNASGILIPAPVDANGNPQVSLSGSSATTIKNDAIPYGTTTNITYAGLPSYNKQIVVVVNNTNETITLTPAGGITTDYYESNYLSGNTIGQIPVFTVTAGQAITLFNLPVAPENELSPSFTTAPATGTYDVDIYLWRE